MRSPAARDAARRLPGAAAAVLALALLAACGNGDAAGRDPATRSAVATGVAVTPSPEGAAPGPSGPPAASSVSANPATAGGARSSTSKPPASTAAKSPAASTASQTAQAPVPAPVPDVLGAAYADAAARLTAAGFTVVRVDAVSAKPQGTVTATSPASGTQAAKGTRVTVTVAKPDTAVVPDIMNKSYRDATATVRAAGLVMDQDSVDHAANPVWNRCYVVAFTPPAGTVVAKGSLVDITRVYGCG
ncbi:PASTA domain-containing protein [Yinghuangia seranimata]|uniref:PASTA domain-containing protein n=1 Tax=Yinghuangia seranimata TaxID=408067 RepID=UPI00248B2BBA|nr:PASTA domain-containing protein [Yinghuangia seranimata]MDI2129111.1 PASTA domain-containing protein [Yinghuangia seranimata]